MDSVKLVLEYLRECEVFYMATVDGLEPRVRPMSGVCEVEGSASFSPGPLPSIMRSWGTAMWKSVRCTRTSPGFPSGAG